MAHALVLAALTFSLLLAGCTYFPSPTPTSTPWPSLFPTPTPLVSPTPSISPSPTPSIAPSATPMPGTLASVRYAVLAAVGGDIQFCDPDYYPVGSPEREQQNAESYVSNPPDRQEFEVILQHLGMSGTVVFSTEQKLTVYREYKRINAVSIQPQTGGYAFHFMVQYPDSSGPSPGPYGENTFVVKGTVTPDGTVIVTSQEPGMLMCPICLAAGTWIDTPHGSVLVEDLRVGDSVFTQDSYGQKVAAPIIRVASRPTQPGQPIVHLVLEDGRNAWLSEGHPLADGRLVRSLAVGNDVDGSRVARIETGRYDGTATYDVLPAGSTGTYWANGVLLGSTLK